ncbi:hypothetical protein [Cognatiluteimonas telluris]|uniref:hypothetical protein n=1 Tax=Cognatiluteimonas telluris TaxID=1104775 RepID=UPI0014082EC8|nr:hypothetical protein [Lysobacter telluris]
MRQVLLAALIAILAGCASSVIAPKDASPVPKEFVFAVSEPAASSATAIFTRDMGGPPGHRWIIYIDGNPAVKLGRGEKYTAWLDPGDHVFGIEPDAKIKVLQVMNIGQSMSAGKTYFFRAMFTREGYRLQPSSANVDQH